MLSVLCFVLLCSNFIFVKSEDNGNITIDVKVGGNCTTNLGEYTFIDGLNVTMVIKSNKYISDGWWRYKSPTGSKAVSNNLKSNPQHDNHIIEYIHLVDKSMEGEWEFEFSYLQNIDQLRNSSTIKNNGGNYTQSVCSTKVRVVSPKSMNVDNDNKLIITSAIGIIALVVIILQAAYIVLLKNKASKLITLNTHNNLSKKTEPEPIDTARYCSNPGQRMTKLATLANAVNRDSVIYEAPNNEITGNARIPMEPPHPPAITSMPRTPRLNHKRRTGPHSMLPSTFNSLARPSQEREVNVANRPPLPLPPQGYTPNNKFQEVYEEMENVEENTYEPPPVLSPMTPRLPMPPKKVPTSNPLSSRENTLKSRTSTGFKPAVTPRPVRPGTSALAPNNELEQALRRRNTDAILKPNPEQASRRKANVMPVPIMSIPDPSARSLPRQKPQPMVKKPKGQPVPHPTREGKLRRCQRPWLLIALDIYYNENQASSDEEWTYEPLKPLKSYETNIYNV